MQSDQPNPDLPKFMQRTLPKIRAKKISCGGRWASNMLQQQICLFYIYTDININVSLSKCVGCLIVWLINSASFAVVGEPFFRWKKEEKILFKHAYNSNMVRGDVYLSGESQEKHIY